MSCSNFKVKWAGVSLGVSVVDEDPLPPPQAVRNKENKLKLMLILALLFIVMGFRLMLVISTHDNKDLFGSDAQFEG